MRQNDQRLIESERSPLIGASIACAAIIITAGLGLLTWNLIETSDKRVEAIKEVKVTNMADPSRAESAAAERHDVDKQVLRDYLDNPNGSTLSYKGLALTDHGLKYLERMTSLRSLRLGETEITDKGLESIASLPLEELGLDDTHITDRGLAVIARIKTLHELDVPGTKISSEGIEYIKALHRLSRLDASETKIDGRALLSLAQIPSLRTLKVGFTNINEKDLGPLLKMPFLKTLDLRNICLTEVGAAILAKLTTVTELDLRLSQLDDLALETLCSQHLPVEKLNLSNTNITDKGLMYIRRLPALRSLQLDECTRITKSGVAKLRREMPGASIQNDPNWRDIDNKEQILVERHFRELQKNKKSAGQRRREVQTNGKAIEKN